MERKYVKIEGLKYKYFVTEDLNFYKEFKGKEILIKKRADNRIDFVKNNDKVFRPNYIGIALDCFYGGYFRRRKYKVSNGNTPLSIKDVSWATGFTKGIDYNYLHNLNTINMTFENVCVRNYLYSKDHKEIFKMLDRNKGLFYLVFKDLKMLGYFNEWYSDFKVKILNFVDKGILIPKENCDKIRVYLKKMARGYALTLLSKKVASNNLFVRMPEYYQASTCNIYDDKNKEYEDLDDEISDMFNYFSS